MTKRVALLCTLVLLVLVTGFVYIPTVHTAQAATVNKKELVAVLDFPTFFDIEGKPIEQFNNTIKTATLLELSPHTVQAFLSIEDKTFYKHNGMNYKRVVGAMVNNVKAKRLKEGASTISQQLVKNTYLTNEKTFKRKYEEVMTTFKLEKQLSKEEILTLYLNTIFFGRGAYGISHASLVYFGKKANDLNLAESATLAAIIKAPNFYSKPENHAALLKRRNLVLSEIYKDERCSLEEYNKAKASELAFISAEKQTLDIAYKNAVLEEVSIKTGIPIKALGNKNLNIYTTFSQEKQDILNEAEQKEIKRNKRLAHFLNASVMLDTHGRVLAMTGEHNQTHIMRQPASAAKPFMVYAPAFEKSIVNPLSLIEDSPIEIDGWKPANASGTYDGWVTVKDSLKRSLNTPTVRLYEKIGAKEVDEFSRKCGINLDNQEINNAISLGSFRRGMNVVELAGAYLPLASEGEFIKPYFVEKIELKTGGILYKNKSEKTQVFRTDTAFLVTDILKEATRSGTSKNIGNLGFDVAAKTGTQGSGINAQNTDIYSVAYTTENIVVSWVGSRDFKDRNTMPKEVNGATVTTNLNKKILENLYKEHKPKGFKIPPSVVELRIDKDELKKGKLLLASEYAPEENVTKSFFSVHNRPWQKSENFPEPTMPGSVWERFLAWYNYVCQRNQ